MPKKKSLWRRTGVVVGTVAAVTLAAAGGAVAVTGRATEQYRTAEVVTGDVSQSVAASGTLTSLSRVDAAFSTAGTVASVAVAVGDSVTAGQELATLDADELADAVTEAQEALTAAQEALESDLEAQTNGDTVDSISSGTSSSSGGASGGGVAGMGRVVVPTADTTTDAGTPDTGSGQTGGQSAEDLWQVVDQKKQAVQDAQQALLDYYTNTASAVISSAKDTLDALADTTDGDTSEDADAAAQQVACTTFLTATAESIATADGLLATQQAFLTCQTAASETLQAALTAMADAQTQLTTLSTALDDAVTALNDAITTARAADEESGDDSDGQQGGGDTDNQGGGDSGDQQAGGGSDNQGGGENNGGTDQSGQGGQSGQGNQSGQGDMPTADGNGTGSGALDTASGALGDALSTGTGSGESGEMSSGTSSGVEVTAQRILADQAAVDEAQAQLDIATAAQTAGTLTSPIAGTVAQVAMAVGDTVTASSSTAVITILGEAGYVVTTTLDLSDVQVLAVGQAASGTVGGYDGEVAATVSSIGVTNVSSTTTPQFEVLLAVDDPTSGLLEGASASLQIAVAQQEAVTVVPTSAVHRDGTSVTVDVLTDGTSETRDVTVGAIGADYTEITDGLEVGEQVILADLTIDATAEDEEESTSFTGGFGSFSGGSMPSGDVGGFTGGGMPGGFSG